MRTLIYHAGGLGDFITILPLIDILKREPGTDITLLGKPHYGSLAKTGGTVDSVIDMDSSSCNHLFLYPLSENSTTFFSPFNRLILFCTEDAPLHLNAHRCFPKTILRQDPLPKDTGIAIVDYRLSLVPGFLPPSHPVYPDLSSAVACSSNEELQLPSGRTAAIHTGSGSAIKNWPVERFFRVADLLRSENFSIVWFSGPADSIVNVPFGDRHYSNAPLTKAAAILSRCSVYLGNDSGFSHLAAAVGCPTVVLFGPSDPSVWAPRGRNGVHIIRHMQPCAPCHLSRSVVCRHECLSTISSEEVVSVLLTTVSTVWTIRK